MLELTRAQAQGLAAHVAAFGSFVEREICAPLAAHLRGSRPHEVNDLLAQVALLSRTLEAGNRSVTIHQAQLPLVKRILIHQRRAVAEAIEEPLRKAIDSEVIKAIRRELVWIEHFMSEPWFPSTASARMPSLTDYMSIRYAEAAVLSPSELKPREYDEKFHILEAPALFLPDLAHYRRSCAVRSAPISVAFVDIDDFKAFNTRYTETKVDLVMLGPFMELVEAHVFGHGHAYRFGGDEYVLLLPNMSAEWALTFVRSLQRRLADASFVGIERPPTISAGLVTIGDDCPLIDREVLARANEAKNFAKAHDRARIAACQEADGSLGPLSLA